MSFLEVCDLTKSFGDVEVLRGIDFSMDRGEAVAVIGASGGGKTTFLRCLNFLEKPDAGKIYINGEEIYNAQTEYTDAEIREKCLHFGLVFQSFNLFPQYSAINNIFIPLNLRTKEKIRRKGIRGKEFRDALRAATEKDRATAAALLDRVGLSDRADNYPCQLSGGQCQRVAIARALALSPDILCFDEPTSALDPELTGEVLKVIRSLKNDGRTMIIVTHEMAFARDVADKVIFMAGGEIAEAGTPDEIFGAPKTEALKNFLRRTDEEKTGN